jgi:hypothetical protein
VIKLERSKRTKIMGAAGLVLLFLCSWQYFASQRARALSDLQDADDCRALASRIKRLSQQPNLAGKEFAASELAHALEEAARQAGVASDAIVRLSPESPRRVGATLYSEKRVQVSLRQITLLQTVQVLSRLCEQNPAVRVQSLRFAAPRQQEGGDRWNVELVLCHLVYEPALASSKEKE